MGNRQGSTTSDAGSVGAIIRGWTMAGLMGLTVSITFVLRSPFETLPPIGTGLLGMLIGWSIMLAFAPWRQMRRVRRHRRDIETFVEQIRRLHDHDDREDLIKSLASERGDHLGELSRFLHGALTDVANARSEIRLLQKSMHKNIEQATIRTTAKLQKEAQTDPLTGLKNRRAMQRWVKAFCEDNRDGGYLVAVAIDVDRFKPINDTLGHEAGDECLVFLSSLLKSNVRADHLITRLGGDEFVLLMPNAIVEEGEAVAERLAMLYRQMPWSHANVSRPTLSIGVARGAVRNREQVDALLRQADEALYASKRAGRSRITVHNEAQAAA